MPIQKIYKGSDILFNIKLTDANGLPFRVNAIAEFSIKFYTTDPLVFVECKYKDTIYTGIIPGDTLDSIVLNTNDINRLEDGVLKYTYSFKIGNSNFNDGTYDETINVQTKIYLKSNN